MQAPDHAHLEQCSEQIKTLIHSSSLRTVSSENLVKRSKVGATYTLYFTAGGFYCTIICKYLSWHKRGEPMANNEPQVLTASLAG